jgi:hypothetical protein
MAFTQADLYVSAAGDDSGDGSAGRPFATLQRARDAARDLRRGQPLRDRPLVIRMEGGTYFLDRTLAFTPEDSGTEHCPLIIEAVPGSKPVLSGGVRISGWALTEDGHWQTRLPETTSGNWQFFQLFVNGERRRRPRWPKDGYSFVARKLDPTPQAASRGFDRFGYAAGDILPEWRNLNDVEVLMFHIWTMSRMRISSIDAAARVVTFTAPTRCTAAQCDMPPGARYIVENVGEALDSPGEWYLDRPSGLLTYIPVEGERLEFAEVIAPRLEQLVTIEGPAGAAVEHIQFRGIAFAHANYAFPREGYSSRQAEPTLAAAVAVSGGRNISFVGCEVSHTGGYGIWFYDGSKHNRVEDCVFSDLGGGGVKLGHQDRRPSNDALLPSHNIIRRNRILHGGRVHPSAAGVLIVHTPYNTVENNDILDFHYTGVSAGWIWGYADSPSHHNIIAHNRIGQIGQGVLSDMGGIYTLGVSPGTVLRRNLIYDVDAFDYGGWGVYLDEGSSEILVENNIVFQTKSGGFHQHYGRDNLITNNLFLLGRECQIQRSRDEPHLSFSFERNIVVGQAGTVLCGTFANSAGYRFGSNLYWMQNGGPIYMGRTLLEQWKAASQDAGSVAADPLFVDIDGGRLELRPGSPARGLGFVPISMEDIGSGADLSALPPARREFPYAQAGGIPVAEDFESIPVSAAPAAMARRERDNATVGVAAGIAVSGIKSLRFSDPAGLGDSYPFVFYSPALRTGTVAGSFWLYRQASAEFWHEWRNSTSGEYLVGPSLRVLPDGSVRAANRTLTTVPQDRWVRFEITAQLGPENRGLWDLEVTQPGGQVQHFRDLAANPQSTILRWWGFVSSSRSAASFYIDDLSLTYK